MVHEKVEYLSMSASLENQTLREKLSHAERLTRELIHHLEHGFIPKAHILRRVARQGNDSSEDITDLTIRSTCEKTLTGDDFTQKLSGELIAYLDSIDQHSKKMLGML